MLGCEWYSTDGRLSSVLSGYRTTVRNLHDALQQLKGISQTVHFRSSAFFIWVISFPDSVYNTVIRSGIPTQIIFLTVSAMRHSPKFVGRARTRSA